MFAFIFVIPFIVFFVAFLSIAISIVKGHYQSKDTMQSMIENISKQRVGKEKASSAETSVCEYCGSNISFNDIKCKSCGAKIKNRK